LTDRGEEEGDIERGGEKTTNNKVGRKEKGEDKMSNHVPNQFNKKVLKKNVLEKKTRGGT